MLKTETKAETILLVIDMSKPRFSIEELKTLAASKNIAEHLNDDDLEYIGGEAIEHYEDDFGKASNKLDKYAKILDQINQVKEAKNFPWPNASNIKYPIITEACIRFAARMYPEIVQSGRIARVKVNGDDQGGIKQERADRVERHLNHQLSEKICNWEPDMDRLLARLPVYGLYYKKIYFDRKQNKPVVDICSPSEIITSNQSSSIKDDKRITHILKPFYRNDIIERIRAGMFLNLDLPNQDSDEEEPEQFLEQHCFLDLDEDGYEEPYIVTIHKESKTVFRIVARYSEGDILTTNINKKEVILRINPFTHFVKYYFMPSFDESSCEMGFGELLLPLNSIIDTLINQLIDAGTMENMQGGFIGRGVRMEDGPFRVSMGEWIPIEARGGSLRDNIIPLPTNGASSTLFSMLGMMSDQAKMLSASNMAMPGEIPANTPATTFLGWIEEGMKVYSSIHKRIFNSLKEEIRKIYRLNNLYGDPNKYQEFHDIPMNLEIETTPLMFEDYNFDDEDISPAASPEVSSDMQRMVKANALIGMLDSQGAMAGGLDPRAIVRNYLEATRQQNIDEIQPPPQPTPQGPSLEEQMVQMQSEIENRKLDIKEYETRIKEVSEHIRNMKTLAEAEAIEAGSQLEQYQKGVQNIADMLEIEKRTKELEASQQAPAPVPMQPEGIQ